MSHSFTQLTDLPAHLLLSLCWENISRYKLGRGRDTKAECCTEIVRRSAAGDEEALKVLLKLSEPIIIKKCPQELISQRDDVAQRVLLRILNKFRNPKNPYRASAFAAYLTYLNLTIRSVANNMLTREREHLSLEYLQAETGFEPSLDSQTERVEHQMLSRYVLNLLTDPLEREVIYRRYVLQESPAEIVRALRPAVPDIDKRQVYRLTERAIRRLKNHSEIQEMAKW